MQWGSRLKFFQDLAERATTEEEIPQCLRSRPVLNQFQEPYWRAYRELTGSRQFTSGGVAEIPYSLKLIWLDENEVTCRDERRDFLQILSALDTTYLEYYYEKAKRTA